MYAIRSYYVSEDQLVQVCDEVRQYIVDIVSVLVHVTDMAELDAVHKVRREFFREPYPASTLVQVPALVRPGQPVEHPAHRRLRHDLVLGAEQQQRRLADPRRRGGGHVGHPDQP